MANWSRTTSRWGRRRAAVLAALLIAPLVLAAAGPGAAQREANALYATAGLGILNLEEGTGLGVPFGFTLLSTRYRLLATVTPLDYGLMEEDNPRYMTIVDSYSGLTACYDRGADEYVPYYNCTPGTDFSRSGSVELSLIPIETVYFAGKVGRLHTGMGMRLHDPRTLYGTVGLFFDSASGSSAAGVRVCMGREFIFMGVTWGVDVRRILRGL